MVGDARRRSGVLVALLLLGGCASHTEGVLSDGGPAPALDDDLVQVVEDAVDATLDVGSADLTVRLELGPQTFEFEGEWSDDGVGHTLGTTDGGGTLVEVEVIGDGETVWIRSDLPAFTTELPDGVSWVEGSHRDLLASGDIQGLDATWDPLLFLGGLTSIEDTGTDSADGTPLRMLTGTVDYEAAYDDVSDDERARMDRSLRLHGGDVDFAAEIGIDDQGRIRTLDYDIAATPPGGDVGIPVRLTVRVDRFDHDVEPPEPPDPGTTIAADEVPDALATLGSPTARPDAPADEPAEQPDLDDDVEAREPPDPRPPDAATPPDALAVTTVFEGHGDPLETGDQITVHYVGKTADGEVFDSSWERDEPFTWTFGDEGVIVGFNDGMVAAKAGERRRIILGSDKAYGAEGGPGIPPNAPLVFEIDVVRITPAG